MAKDDQQQFTVFRSYKQIEWLHNKLYTKHVDILIPPFPEVPTNVEADYLEKKRLQMGRYLHKIFHRKELESDNDTAYFLSEQMTPLDVSHKKSSFVQLPLFGFMRTEYHQGFRIFVPSEFVDGIDDQEEFIMRKTYITTLEINYQQAVDCVVKLIKAEEAVGRGFSQFFTHLKEVTDTEGGSSVAAVNLMVEFSDKQKLNVQMKIKNDIWLFGDVLLEYSHTTESLKRLMNERTDRLIDYVEALKTKTKRFEKVQKLKFKNLADDNPEMVAAVGEEKQAEEDIAKKMASFQDMKLAVTREMKRFEKEKTRDLHQALKDYAKIQVKFGNELIDTITQTLRQIPNH